MGRTHQHAIGFAVWILVLALQLIVLGPPVRTRSSVDERSLSVPTPQNHAPTHVPELDSVNAPYPPGYTVGGPRTFGPAIARADAVILAEQFVADNGFTTAPPDRSKLRFDIADCCTVDEVLARRHNTLRPEAYGYTRTYRGGDDGWTIVFRYREGSAWGMAVTMYPDGSDIHRMHLGLPLRNCKRLP